eukprot:3941679-Rhodomonas_salina.1
MVLWHVRYGDSVWCYGTCGTEIAYGVPSEAVSEPLSPLRPLLPVPYVSTAHRIASYPLSVPHTA